MTKNMSDFVDSKNLRLDAQGISKSFGLNRVLNNVNLAIAPGEIHALVGQNGSGKSTLIKILSGHHSPNSGASLKINDQNMNFPISISDLRSRGISILHQDFGLVDEYSVVENVRIANFSVNNWTRSIKWDYEKEVVAELLRELNCAVDPNAKVGSLGPVDRAKVAIARSLQSARMNNIDNGINLLVFDESTRALPRDSLSEFYEEISKLVAAGTSVLLVSHSLDEVVTSADRVTVLRDGEVLASGVGTSEITERDLVQIMLGYQLHEPRPKKIFGGNSDLLQNKYEVSQVSGQTVKGINFEVHSGEILGLTGLEGSGFEEIPYLLSGAKGATSGTLNSPSESVSLCDTDIHKLIKARVFLVPERRESEGLAFGESVLENITLPRVRERAKRFSIGKFWQHEEAIKAIGQFGIHPPHAGVAVGRLSGGNQQKVQLGKWLLGGPKLLLLHEPTQGVDVGARRDIVNAIIDLAESGVAVVVATIELELLEEICHRVIIFQEGEIGSIVTEVSVRNLIDSVHPDPEIKVG